MTTTKNIRSANQPSQQAPDPEPPKAVLAEQILLGLDLHSDHIRMVRQIDGTNPQPAQRLSWEQIEEFCRKQLLLAKKVYAVYEAGAFGFGLCRRLGALGVTCYVMHPVKLDPQHRGVQTDKTDARELCERLGRYVAGNRKAMAVVTVPTEAQENQRVTSRHRRHLSKEMLSLQAHGRGLLLCQGFRAAGSWWTEKRWAELSPQLSPEMRASLADCRILINQYEALLKPVEKALVAAAPPVRPKGLGALTCVLLFREIFNWGRFKNRRQVAGFLGLGGGVSSSSKAHYDLSITKAGNPYLRTLLVETAWRMVRYQPKYHALRKWQHILGPEPSHKRHRKRAIVAVSRQLAVDLWKWQTGQVTLEALGLTAI